MPKQVAKQVAKPVAKPAAARRTTKPAQVAKTTPKRAPKAPEPVSTARMLRNNTRETTGGKAQACYAPGEVPILEVIRDKMRELVMSQGDVANALTLALGSPLSRSAVGRWMRREAVPNMRQQVALANLWGLSMDQLHGRNVESGARYSLEDDVMQRVHSTLLSSVHNSVKPSMRVVTHGTISTPFFPLRPQVMVDTEHGPLLSVFVMEGNATDVPAVVGMAYALFATGLQHAFYLAWINHGTKAPDFAPLKRLGLLGDSEIVPARDVDELSQRGVIFANLRARIRKALAA